MPLCLNLKTPLAELTSIHHRMTSQGLRVLAVAKGRGPTEHDLEYLGLIAMADPLREEAKKAIQEAQRAGITVVMITGDHPTTAAAIAQELGLLRAGDKLEERVHSRATPAEKLQIIRDWKSRGAIVAMTGDGVNDAPALREAHIGIAMGKTGTEVTRQAADLILEDDNFATIISAVKEGRGIYQNVRRATVFLLAGNFGELFVVVGASLLQLPLPFLAAHLLWINLVTDSLPALALASEPISADVMDGPPRSSKEKLLRQLDWQWVVCVGFIEGSVMLALFFHTLKNQDLAVARNLTFTALVLSQLFRSFSARSRTRNFFQAGPFGNPWLVAVVFGTASLQLGMHFLPFAQNIFGLRPLSWDDLKTVLLVSLISVTLIEIHKLTRKDLIFRKEKGSQI